MARRNSALNTQNSAMLWSNLRLDLAVRRQRLAGGHVLAQLLTQLGDQASPAGLVAGADSAAVIAVEVFVEWNIVSPVRIALEQLGIAEHRSPAIVAAQEDVDQAPRKLVGDLIQRQILP